MRISQGSSAKGRLGLTAVALAVALPGLTACKVVPIAADRAARERLAAAFDASRYVDAIWSTQALPHWEKSKRPLVEVATALDQDPVAAARKFGRVAGEGALPVYVVEGEGRVVSAGQGRARRVAVEVVRPNGPLAVELQVGPVVSGTALRDSLPFVTFNDFANQIDFAAVASALTKQALATNAAAIGQLKVGDRVRFVAAMPADGQGPLVATPLRVEVLGAGA